MLSPQQTYQNVQEDAPDGEPSETEEAPKRCEGSCDQSCDQEEEEQPLMKTNNYKFCWGTHLCPEVSSLILNINSQPFASYHATT